MNLINSTGREKLIGDKFSNIFPTMKIPDISYTWFDFHKECKKMQWQHLSKLIRGIEEQIDGFDYFMAMIDNAVYYYY